MTSANHAILLHSDDTALLIAKFLAAKDMLCLRSVSRGLYNVLTNNEELIFKEYIKRDFVEGEILLYIVEKRHLLHKVNLSLYLLLLLYHYHFYLLKNVSIHVHHVILY